MKKVKMFVFLVLSLCFTVFIASAEEVNAADMHRLYNPNSGEHFYTANGNEKNHLVKVGWKYEGIGWTAPATGNAVYRLYNANAGDHHYTLNANEKNHLVKVGWKYEGIGWYSDVKKTIPLYRAYNPNAKAGSHNYTVNYAEQKNLIQVGWRDEGIAWYGINKSTPVTKYTVTVKHVGSDGKTLNTSTASVEKGKSYTAKAGSFSGYTLKGSNSQTVTVNGNKTITFNYTKNAVSKPKYTVTVVHKDIKGKELAGATTATVEEGKSYTARAVDVKGYTVTNPNSRTVTVHGNMTVTFTYLKNDSTYYTVTVKYVDENGKNVRPASRKLLEKGDSYVAEAIYIPDYTVKGNKIQTIPSVSKDETLTFVYTENTAPVTYKVTVKHMGSDGKTLKTVTETIEEDKSYTANAESFTGYTQPSVKTQKVTVTKDMTLTFTYTVNKYNVTVVHKGSDGKTLETEKAVSANYGTSYIANAKTYTGYTQPSAKTQTVTVNKDMTITFTYTVNKYNVTVVHKGSDGKTLETEKAVSANYGTSFTANAKTYSGYTQPSAKTQTVTVIKDMTITFTYKKNATPVTQYTVTIKHMGSDGKTLKTATANVDNGKSYTANAESFTGYTQPSTKTQTITVTKDTTLTFTYTVNKYNVTVVHKGSDGKTLETEKAVSANYGTSFTGNAKTYTGYTQPSAKTQTVTVTKDMTLTFTYTVNKYNITVVHKGSDGTTLETEKAVSVDYGKSFTANAKTYTGYTQPSPKTQTVTVIKDMTITFTYTKNAIKYNVTVIHKGNDGKMLLTEPVVVIEQGKSHTANSKEFSGYKLNGKTTQTFTINQDRTITFNYNNLSFDKVTLNAVVDGSVVKTSIFNVKPGELFNPSLDKLELDPNKYDLSLRPLYPVVTGQGGRELEFDFEITLFKNYLTETEKQIMKETILQKINDLRTNQLTTPVGKLTEHTILNEAANVRAVELKQLFKHTRPNTTEYYTAIKEAGLPIENNDIHGENIWRVQGSREMSGKILGERAFASWLGSTGHKATMIDPNYNYIGIGIYNYGNDTYCSLLVIRK